MCINMYRYVYRYLPVHMCSLSPIYVFPIDICTDMYGYVYQYVQVSVQIETYYSVKRDLLQCQKRPTDMYGYVYQYVQVHVQIYSGTYRDLACGADPRNGTYIIYREHIYRR